MKFAFAQIYMEVGADYDLPGPLLDALAGHLDAKGWNISELQNRFKNEWKLVIIISAKKGAPLEVRGPTYVRKSSEVEFVIFVPFEPKPDFISMVEYVLPQLQTGMARLFARYGEPAPGMDDACNELVRAVRENPEEYQYR